ncbi:hypothetical protein BSKO_07111 [Bryopsis sp. KO-2023]|nr:hypothetical protein BSKO_07111 [Bryopsis sp. KO-2023]
MILVFVWPQSGAFVLALVLAVFRLQPGAGCDISQPEFKVKIPITSFSCDERSLPTGPCIKDEASVMQTDFQHRGSELNDGGLDLVETDEDCCEFCQRTPGCRAWTRIQNADQFNKMGACWMKSSVPKAKGAPFISGGIVPPSVEAKVACNPMSNVGFWNRTEYNHPELLLTDSAATCCLRCQEQKSLCYAWMWMMTDKHCHLYANPVPSSAEFLCRDCVSGHHAADRGKVRRGWRGEAGALFEGDGRITLAPKGAFITGTSKECSGLCDATRVCYSEECEIAEGITMPGSDLFCTQPAAPYGNRLVVSSQEECCAMCQEYPECSAWTFTKGDITQSSTACWIKFSPPDQAQKPVGGKGTYASGIIRSRLTDDQIKKFREAVDNAVEIAAENADQQAHLGGGGSPGFNVSLGGGGRFQVVMTAILVATGAVIMVVFVITLLIFVRRTKKKEEKINAERRKALESSRGGQPLMESDSTSLMLMEKPSSQYGEVSISFVNADLGPMEVRKERLDQLKQKIAEAREKPGGVVIMKGERRSTPFVLKPGTVLGDKYIIEEGTMGGDASYVFNARQKFGHAVAVVMKFYSDREVYEGELNFFSQQIVPLYVPQVFDMFEDSVVESWGLPRLPCIVIERGDISLKKNRIDSMDQRNILFRICSALQSIHQYGIVHRSISSDNILLYGSSMSWKLIDFGWWATRGSKASIEYSLRYAPPEVLIAHARGDQQMVAKRAIDVWAVGIVFWEVLTGEAMFGENYTDEEVMAMLLGVEPLPFEKNPNFWEKISQPVARRLVANLLHRSPNARYPMKKVLSNGFFSTGIDTDQQHNMAQRTELARSIAQSVGKIEEKMDQAIEIMFENFKHTVGNVLLACFSFYEISPEEFADKNPSAASLAEGFKNSTLNFTETFVEPSYNVFKRSKEEPTPLLRLDKKHLLKITLMYGNENQMDLPITEIAYCKIWPTDINNDVQDAPVFCVSHEGNVLQAVAVWDTMAHRDFSLKLIGNASLDIVIGVKLQASNKIVEVRKTIEIRMMDPNEKFRIVKAFHRTTKWYSNLPPWAKLYIHGAITIVKLSKKAIM